MTLLIRYCAAIALAALLYASGSGLAKAQVADQGQEPDPVVWGVYAQLVGTEWNGAEGSGRGPIHWKWGDGEHAGAIIEQEGTGGGRWFISRGDTPGTLKKDFSRGVHHFIGTIAADGSVLWIRKGWIKIPHRVSLVGQELHEENGLELEGEEVVSVEQTTAFTQANGREVAAAAAAPAVPVESLVVADPVVAADPPGVATPAIISPLWGETFLGADFMVRFPLAGQEDGFSIEYSRYNGEPMAVYRFHETGERGVYRVTSNKKNASFAQGWVKDDGTVVLEFGGENHRRETTYRLGRDGLTISERVKERNGWRKLIGEDEWKYTSNSSRRFSVYSRQAYEQWANYHATVDRVVGTPRQRAELHAREMRQARIESDRALGRAFQNTLESLSDYSAQQVQAREDADAMMRQTRMLAEQAAVQQAAQPRTMANVAPKPGPAKPRSTPQADSRASKPLKFYLTIGLRNIEGDRVNPSCYSNIITAPAPAGWPSTTSAHATAERYKAAFISKCRANGREVTNEGDFSWRDNSRGEIGNYLPARGEGRSHVIVTMP